MLYPIHPGDVRQDYEARVAEWRSKLPPRAGICGGARLCRLRPAAVCDGDSERVVSRDTGRNTSQQLCPISVETARACSRVVSLAPASGSTRLYKHDEQYDASKQRRCTKNQWHEND